MSKMKDVFIDTFNRDNYLNSSKNSTCETETIEEALKASNSDFTFISEVSGRTFTF